MFDYAKAIRLYRERKFLTQIELAKILGVSPLSVVRWENGKFAPTMKTKKQIYNLLKEANILLEEVK
ncbi:helix-turn-helix domain-containing protein [Metamycoplasma hominis]|uniref:helix-turn-helix domain-containing protein n=1 Tax=Metamycoplasma hominis TaxID=2098 RepID=UPI000304FDB3